MVLLSLLVAAGYVLALHLCVLQNLPDPLFQPDSFSYIEPALRLLHHQPMDLTPERTPGYPLFLFGLLRLTPHFRALLFAQHALLLLTGLCAARIYSRYIEPSRGAAAIVAFLVTISPMAIIAAHTVLTETLYGFALLVAVLGLWDGRSGARWGIGVATFGLVLTVLVRPIGVALWLVTGIAALLTRSLWRAWGCALAVALVLLLGVCSYRKAVNGFFGLDRFAGISLFGSTAAFLDVKALDHPAYRAALAPVYARYPDRLDDWNWVRYASDGPVAALRRQEGAAALNTTLLRLSFQAVRDHPFRFACAQGRCAWDFLTHRSRVPGVLMDPDYPFFIYRGLSLYAATLAPYGATAYGLLASPAAGINRGLDLLRQMHNAPVSQQAALFEAWRHQTMYHYAAVLRLWAPLRPLFNVWGCLPWLALVSGVVLLRSRAHRRIAAFFIALILAHIVLTNLGGDSDLRHALPLESFYWILTVGGIRALVTRRTTA